MRILLTGVTGYLGSNLASFLISNGHSVTGLKRASSSLNRVEKILPNLSLYNIDESDLSSFFREQEKFDVLIHTATSYGREDHSVIDLINSNLVIPLNLLDVALDNGVKCFINTGTSLDKLINPYALSKSQFSDWGKYLSKVRNFSFVNLKLEHFYGPGDDKKKFISLLISSCLSNVPELNLTDGNQLRDFIYIDDLLSVFKFLINSTSTFEPGFHEIDVGSGSSVELRQLVKFIHEITDSKTRLNFGALPYRDFESMLSRADTTMIESLGWKCIYDIRAGITKTIELEKGLL